MKQKVITGLKILLKTAVAAALFLVTWLELTPYFRVDRNTDGDLFRNLDPDSIDVLALGSSHMQYAFNPAVLYQETGYYGYVLGSSCQPFSTSYYLLEEALKTQHPSVVLIDVFTLLPGSQVCYADGMYYKAIDMMSGKTRIEAGKHATDTLSSDLQLAYTYDFILNHDHWKDMDFSDPESILQNAEPAEGIHWDLGYVRQMPTVFQYTPLQYLEPDNPIALSEEEKQWIDKLIDLCKENEIHLIFLKTPYDMSQTDSNKPCSIWAYLEEKGADYIDYVRKAADQEIDWYLDMDGDTWHNNAWGAEIVTSDLGKYLVENQLVTNHQDNELFRSVADGAVRSTAESLMNTTNLNVYTLISDSRIYPSTVLLRYRKEGSGLTDSLALSYLEKLGLNTDFSSDYYAVIQDGKVLSEGTEPFDYELNGHTISFSEDDITIDGTSGYGTGTMCLTFAADDFSWINPIPISYDQHSFWKDGCDSWSCTVTSDQN